MRTQETNLLPRLLFWVSPPYHSCWTIPNPNGTPIMVVSAVQVQKNTSKWKISSWLGYIYLSFTRQVWRTYSLKLKLWIRGVRLKEVWWIKAPKIAVVAPLLIIPICCVNKHLSSLWQEPAANRASFRDLLMLLYFFQKELKGKLLRMDLSKALGHNRFFENRCIKLGCAIMFIVMSVKKFHVPYKAGYPLKTKLKWQGGGQILPL